MRSILLFLLGLLSAVASASITVYFPADGKYRVWTAPDYGAIQEAGRPVEGNSVTFDGVLSEYLFATNEATGNIWVKKTRSLEKDWYPSDADLKLAAKVRIRVEHEGKPVASASVRINDGTPRLMDKESEGVATVENVRLGDMKVEVAVKVGRRDRVRRQTFELPVRRDEKEPTFVFALTDKVEVIEPPVATAAKTEAPKPAPEATGRSANSLMSSLFVFLVSLAAAGALLYYGLKWIQNNQEKAAAAMNSIGVPMPDPVDPAAVSADPVAPVVPSAPGPAAPIILDPATSPVSTTPVSATPAPADPPASGPILLTGTTEARFVDEHGIPWPIPEGISVVGRESTHPLNFGGDQTLSRNHAEVVRRGSLVRLRDSGSTNGTFQNGQRVSGEVTLSAGDQVQFGAVKLRFE